MPKKMPLYGGAALIIEKLHGAGYEANVVGGAVRNHILGIPVSDFDITTSATPDITARVFSDFRIIETGIKHGTVTILADGGAYEVTTYRTDGSYVDNRHPESVSFTPNLSEDLARRDFTVNAICYNPYDGFTDLFDGIGDIKRRVIRAVGDPKTRFLEDALRILRAIRFASVLGFTVEQGTAAAVVETAPLLKNVSRERVYVEWTKLLGGVGAYDVISEYSGVISTAVRELETITLPCRERFDRACAEVRAISLFFLSCPDPVSSFDTAMQSLRTDNKTRKTGTNALKIISEYALSSARDVRLAAYRYNRESVAIAIDVAYTVGRLNSDEYSTARAALDGATVTQISDLALGGADLIAAGLKGPAIGEALDALAIAVITEGCANDRDSLLNYLKNL